MLPKEVRRSDSPQQELSSPFIFLVTMVTTKLARSCPTSFGLLSTIWNGHKVAGRTKIVKLEPNSYQYMLVFCFVCLFVNLTCLKTNEILIVNKCIYISSIQVDSSAIIAHAVAFLTRQIVRVLLIEIYHRGGLKDRG